jgi:hypothetical protein
VIKEQFKRTVKLAIHDSLLTLIMVAGPCVPLGPNFGGAIRTDECTSNKCDGLEPFALLSSMISRSRAHGARSTESGCCSEHPESVQTGRPKVIPSRRLLK